MVGLIINDEGNTEARSSKPLVIEFLLCKNACLISCLSKEIKWFLVLLRGKQGLGYWQKGFEEEPSGLAERCPKTYWTKTCTFLYVTGYRVLLCTGRFHTISLSEGRRAV